MANIEEKIVFGLGTTDSGETVILVGIPTGAWEYMKDGKTNHIDFSKAGLPVKLIMYGGKDHETVFGAIKRHKESIGQPFLDERHKDWSISLKNPAPKGSLSE